jgi:hypothetical protein
LLEEAGGFVQRLGLGQLPQGLGIVLAPQFVEEVGGPPARR